MGIPELDVNCRQSKPRIEMMKDACIGRRYFSQLESIRPKDVFSCLVTVRYIHKISINCLCSGCGNAVTRGTCTYVGCHWNQPSCKVDLKAWYSLSLYCVCVCVCVCVWVLGTTSPGARLSLNAALLISASGTRTHTDTQSRISLSATSNSFYLVFSLSTTTTTMLLAVLVMYPIGYSFPDHLIIKSSWVDTLWNSILTI